MWCLCFSALQEVPVKLAYREVALIVPIGSREAGHLSSHRHFSDATDGKYALCNAAGSLSRDVFFPPAIGSLN